MREIVPEQIDSRQIKWLLVALLGGVGCGMMLVAFFLRLPPTYATFLCAGMMLPLAAHVVGNSKRLLLAMVATLLPITVDITINHTGHVGGTAGYVVSLYDAVLLALYVMWFGEMASGKKDYQIRFFPAISIPAILLILVAWLSMTVAENQDLSLYENIQISKLYLTFFYLANNIRNQGEVRFLMLILILGLLFEGMLGFAQHRYDEPFWPTALGGSSWVDSRVTGTWRSYNDFAWYLTFILPIALSMFFGDRSFSYRIASVASLMFGSAALIWTNSRAGWTSLAVGCSFVGVFVFLKTEGRRILAGRFFVVVLVLFLAIPLYPRLYHKVVGRIMGDDRGSAESRFPQYEMAYLMMRDHPALGVGTNNYTIVMHQYDYTAEGIDSITSHAVHNIFLHLGAEIGLPGLIFFLWFISTVFFIGLRGIRGNGSVATYALIGMLGGVLAFLIHGLADVAYLGDKLYLFVWFFSGIICAIDGFKVEEEAG